MAQQHVPPAAPTRTGTLADAAGTEGVAPVAVGHRLEGVRVVDDEGGTVQLADPAPVEVQAGLGWGGQRWMSPPGLCPRGSPRCPRRSPGSRSAWGRCSRRRTARGSNPSASCPCSAGSRGRCCWSLGGAGGGTEICYGDEDPTNASPPPPPQGMSPGWGVGGFPGKGFRGSEGSPKQGKDLGGK